MKGFRIWYFEKYLMACLIGLLLIQATFAQKGGYRKQLRVEDNVMYVMLSKNLPADTLAGFIRSYSLDDLGLYSLLQNGNSDSLQKSGWKLDVSQNTYYTLFKKLSSGTDLKKSADRIAFSAIPTPDNWRIIGDNRVVYGVNRFKGQAVFRQEEGITYFSFNGHRNAKSVKLAGNFTNWQHGAFPMTKTEEGWTAPVKLLPGKYYYKFIVDGHWMTDPFNYLKENDGLGNTNSVYYVPNKQLFLKGYQSALLVVVTGSFNNWSREGIPLQKKKDGWQTDLYLEQGTHRYHFLVDGRPVNENGDRATDDQKVAFGNAYVFVLKGFTKARQVTLAGNFNDWKPQDIFMQPTEDGWRVSYVLGPGNYQYKFIVEGKWITDPANPNIVSDGKGNFNSFMVVAPNYTFRLKGHARARNVHIAGEFNNWSHDGLSMTLSGNEWVCPIYLGKGKHLYKFIVDGKWMRDPDNPLWEDDDENSVLWIE